MRAKWLSCLVCNVGQGKHHPRCDRVAWGVFASKFLLVSFLVQTRRWMRWWTPLLRYQPTCPLKEARTWTSLFGSTTKPRPKTSRQSRVASSSVVRVWFCVFIILISAASKVIQYISHQAFTLYCYTGRSPGSRPPCAEFCKFDLRHGNYNIVECFAGVPMIRHCPNAVQACRRRKHAQLTSGPSPGKALAQTTRPPTAMNTIANYMRRLHS